MILLTSPDRVHSRSTFVSTRRKLTASRKYRVTFREQAQRETSDPSYLNKPGCQIMLFASFLGVAELPSIVGAAMIGDMRLMEAAVAHGAPIGASVRVGLLPHDPLRWAPSDATPLLVVCVDIAGHDAEHTEYDGNLTQEFLTVRRAGCCCTKGRHA
jgi:hypothetical protein